MKLVCVVRWAIGSGSGPWVFAGFVALDSVYRFRTNAPYVRYVTLESARDDYSVLIPSPKESR